MSYIEPQKREILDPLISTVASRILHAHKSARAQALYDAVYYLALESRGDGLYRNWNGLAGTLMCTSAELRRRITSHIPDAFAHDAETSERRWGLFPSTVSANTPLQMKLLLQKLVVAIQHIEKTAHEKTARTALERRNIPRPHEPVVDAIIAHTLIDQSENLNYAITKLCVLLNPANDAGDWLAIEDTLSGRGWLPHRLFQEIYEKYISAYEDKRIRENGDVYPEIPELVKKTKKRKKFLGIF